MTAGDVASWPFWAPSDLESVERALDLAEVTSGEVLVDLGCGDGQVLVAAARRGATVAGVESDAELATLARRALEADGHSGAVIEGDLLELDLDGDLQADIYFTYLAPATLQRMFPTLRAMRTARLVTVDFEVPGVVVDDRAGAANLYLLPGRRRRRPRRPGWVGQGALVVAPPGFESLTVLDLHHPGGAVELGLSGDLDQAAAVLTGADDIEPNAALAVDLRWADHEAGTILAGAIEVEGLEPFAVTAIFDADFDEGCWTLTTEGVANVARHLSETDGDTDAARLVSAAEG